MANKTFYVLEADGTTSRDFDNFRDALAECLKIAERQAGDGVEVSTFINGGNPETDPTDQWEAGAGPAGDSCADWPHVYRRGEPRPAPVHAEYCDFPNSDCTCGTIAWD